MTRRTHLKTKDGKEKVPVYCITKKKVYESVPDAAKILKVSGTCIYRVLKGDQRSTKNLTFRYLDEDEIIEYQNINKKTTNGIKIDFKNTNKNKNKDEKFDINDLNYIGKLKLKIRQLEDKNKILERQILKYTKNKLHTSDKEYPKIIKELDYNGMRYD